MVLFFSTTLAVSVVGITTLILLKRWEMNTGYVLGARARPAIGEFFHRGLVWLEHAAPAILRRGLVKLYRKVRTLLQVSFARVVLYVERGLEKLLGFVRNATEVSHKEGEASEFLREVAEYKKQITGHAPQRIRKEE